MNSGHSFDRIPPLTSSDATHAFDAPAVTSDLNTLLAPLTPEMINTSAWLLYASGLACAPNEFHRRQHFFESALDHFIGEDNRCGAHLAWSQSVEVILARRHSFASLSTLLDCYETIRSLEGDVSDQIELLTLTARLGAVLYHRPQALDAAVLISQASNVLGSIDSVAMQLLLGQRVVMFLLWRGEPAAAEMILDGLRSSLAQQPLSHTQLDQLQLLRTELCRHATSPAVCKQVLNVCSEPASLLGEQQRTLLAIHCAMTDESSPLQAQSLLQRGPTGFAPGYLDQNQYYAAAAWVHLACGELPAAEKHVEAAIERARQAQAPFLEASHQLLKATILCAANRYRTTRSTLAAARTLGRACHSQLLEFNALMIEAELQFQQGQDGSGLTTLRKALDLGRRQGFGTFIGYRKANATRLFERALRANIEPAYIQSLIQRFELTPNDTEQPIESWPWPIKIHALGEFSIEVDGKALSPTRKPQHRPIELLKVIIALGGNNIHQDVIIDILWPDAEGDIGAQTFATTLHRLRKLLKHARAIELSDSHVSLSRLICWSDVRQFEIILSQADAEKGSQTLLPIACVNHVERALQMYKGNFLGQDRQAAWALPIQERLRSKFLRHVTGLGRYWEHNRNWEQAIEVYQTGLETDQLIEQFYQRLIICYHQLGLRTEALSTYQQCSEVLSTILGLSPSAETNRLHDQLLSQAVS
ncbi:MAG TPA: hypothetical protein EYN01_05435 [Chromatiales bacterium]|nr:hypothetical protein [Chromatiales bacterium]